MASTRPAARSQTSHQAPPPSEPTEPQRQPGDATVQDVMVRYLTFAAIFIAGIILGAAYFSRQGGLPSYVTGAAEPDAPLPTEAQDVPIEE